jgi:hypothetical protein
MTEHYPQLLKQEKRRAAAYAWSVVIGLFTPFFLLLAFANDWSNFAGGIALGIVLAVIAAKLVRRFMRVSCPRCADTHMQENYYGGKGSKDVAHTCNNCGAYFDNGTLQKQP